MDKQEAEIREKLKQEKKREERKNREAFSELLREDMDEGFIKPKMRWKVTIGIKASFAYLSSQYPLGSYVAQTVTVQQVQQRVAFAAEEWQNMIWPSMLSCMWR